MIVVPSFFDLFWLGGIKGVVRFSPFAYLFAARGVGFTVFLLLLKVNQESYEYQFLRVWFDLTGNRTQVYRSVADN